jgi:hypothetical protein
MGEMLVGAKNLTVTFYDSEVCVHAYSLLAPPQIHLMGEMMNSLALHTAGKGEAAL